VLVVEAVLVELDLLLLLELHLMVVVLVDLVVQ
jgi:hypothetical protein